MWHGMLSCLADSSTTHDQRWTIISSYQCREENITLQLRSPKSSHMMQESARLPARTVDQSFFERLVLAATMVVPNIVLGTLRWDGVASRGSNVGSWEAQANPRGIVVQRPPPPWYSDPSPMPAHNLPPPIILMLPCHLVHSRTLWHLWGSWHPHGGSLWKSPLAPHVVTDPPCQPCIS